MNAPKPGEETTSAASNDLVSFEFISSEDLRESLEGDCVELTKAISASMWKSACILAGSIAEAVLMDYIAVVSNCNVEVENLAVGNIGLQKLIDAAIGVDVMGNEQPPDAGWEFAQLAGKGATARKSGTSNSLRTAYVMSSAVADFRNLIHPGRELRLKEHVDENLALAARAFTLRLCSDLSKESAARYPYKAEDILEKAKRDASARTILETMLGKTRPAEITRLLDKVAPDAFQEECRRPDETLERISAYPCDYDSEESQGYEDMCAAAELSRKADAQVYRIAFDWGTAAQKRAGLHTIAHLLTTSESGAVVKLETELLQMTDLEYASDEDKKLIVGDVLDRVCSKETGKEILRCAAGLGQWIPADRGEEFVCALLSKKFRPRVDSDTRAAAYRLLECEYEHMSSATQAVVFRSVAEYRNTVPSRPDRQADAKAVDELLEYWNLAPWLQDVEDGE
jgi:hypothetical protein